MPGPGRRRFGGGGFDDCDLAAGGVLRPDHDLRAVGNDRRQVESEPIRMLGEHTAHVRLTIDMVPQIKVIVHREGEAPVAQAVVVEEVVAVEVVEVTAEAIEEQENYIKLRDSIYTAEKKQNNCRIRNEIPN